VEDRFLRAAVVEVKRAELLPEQGFTGSQFHRFQEKVFRRGGISQEVVDQGHLQEDLG